MATAISPRLLLSLLLTALALGCGGRGDDDDGGGSCQSAGRAICERACTCRDGDACAITDETASATISFDTEDDCIGLYVTLGCSGGGDSGIDYAACTEAAAAAECAGDGESAGMVGPPECESPED